MKILVDNSFYLALRQIPEPALGSTLDAIKMMEAAKTFSDLALIMDGLAEVQEKGVTYPIKVNFQYVVGSLKADVNKDGDLVLTITHFE